MQNTRHEESFMPKGKVGSPEWIEHIFELYQSNPREASNIISSVVNEDTLTGLLNVRGLNNTLSNLEESPLGMFYFDLTGFGETNNTLGHDAGDQQLIQFADKLRYFGEVLNGTFRTRVEDRRKRKRKSTYDRRDNLNLRDVVKQLGEATFARKGGDEFFAILPGVSDYETLEKIGFRAARDIIHSRDCPQTSIGGSLYIPGQGTIDEAIHRSDIAMYAAKEFTKDSEGNSLTEEGTSFAIDRQDRGLKIYQPKDLKQLVSE